MKLYRYRPINDHLFKELLYRELYLASTDELNDPLDLNGQINFYSNDKKQITSLSHFLRKQVFMLCIPNHGFPDSIMTDFFGRKNLFCSERLAKYIANEFEKRDEKIVKRNDLSKILIDYVNVEISKFIHDKELGVKLINELFVNLDKLFAQFLGNSKVACFSTSYSNFLMWSHYASGHTGICLEFETNIDTENSDLCYLPLTLPTLSFAELHRRGIDPDQLILREKIRAVKYSSSQTLFDFYKYLPIFLNEGDVDLMNLSKSYWHGYANSIEDSFLEKLKPWMDEGEWRLVHVSFNEEMPEDRIFRFIDNALTGIYFGAKTTSKVRRRVRNAIAKAHCNPTYYQCFVDGTREVYAEPTDEEEYI